MTILKFETTHCGQCKVASQRMTDAGIKFDTINCETAEGEDISNAYGIRNVPTVMILDDNGDKEELFIGLGQILANIDVIKQYSK